VTTLEATSPRVVDLTGRLNKIMSLIVDLDIKRRDLAVAAASGDKSALRAIASLDFEGGRCHRDRETRWCRPV
jgi:hypothetical protein